MPGTAAGGRYPHGVIGDQVFTRIGLLTDASAIQQNETAIELIDLPAEVARCTVEAARVLGRGFTGTNFKADATGWCSSICGSKRRALDCW